MLWFFSELSVSLVEEALSITIARNIGKAVQLFYQKGEQMLSVGGEATQVIGKLLLLSLLLIQCLAHYPSLTAQLRYEKLCFKVLYKY